MRQSNCESSNEGYSHSSYAASLAEFGRPRLLPQSTSWVLERRIPGSELLSDAMGCYPLFCCSNWSGLHSDIEACLSDLVSISLVADPFGKYQVEYLRDCFPDVFIPFKHHYVIDLNQDPQAFIHPHHKRNARQANGKVDVHECSDPTFFIDDWCQLYENLTGRHGISGIAAFSNESFAKQLEVPGVVMFRAVADDKTAGILLWYVQGEIAYYHLGAYSERGYERKASFALFMYAIEVFKKRGLRWLNLGAAAGVSSETAGLARFKEGWATDTRIAYFCGRILQKERYAALLEARHVLPTNYFPAYRIGEFGRDG